MHYRVRFWLHQLSGIPGPSGSWFMQRLYTRSPPFRLPHHHLRQKTPLSKQYRTKKDAKRSNASRTLSQSPNPFSLLSNTYTSTQNLTMADITAPATPPRARGGRGRGNGQQRTLRSNNSQDGAERRERRGGRGRGHGRGGNSNHASNNNQQNPLPPSLPDEGIIGDRPTDGANKAQGETRGKAPAEGEEDQEDDDAEVCFICASPVIHQAVSPCNHRTCHICALRLRALYKSKACAHCRVS